MTGFPNEPFCFLVITVIPTDFRGRSELCDPCPERNEGEQSSTDLAGQLGLENILSNLGKGRLHTLTSFGASDQQSSEIKKTLCQRWSRNDRIVIHPKRNAQSGE